MSEPILKALMQLFALIGDIHDDTVVTAREKNIVRLFLSRHLNNDLIEKYMVLFEEYLSQFNSERVVKGSLQDRKRTSLNAMKILSICERINEELHQKQKVYVLVKLVDFISLGSEITENELDFLQTVGKAFHVPDNEYMSIKSLILNSLNEFNDFSRILVIDSNLSSPSEEIKHLCVAGLKGTLVFLHIPSTNTYIMRYYGNEDLYLNGQNILTGQTYVFDTGSAIRGAGITSVYFSEVAGIITRKMYAGKVFLNADKVTYEFGKSENGIHDLFFNEESGKLVGVIGGSGVGKSTTLSVLSGTLKPDKGEVYVNGYNLYDENERQNLQGIIGFVPQDDLLIEELTVYQNLYYNARLCLSNLPEKRLKDIVEKVLSDLDLAETRNLKVGNPLNKVISGGQRKRLNIALELIREPAILFVDEPTSGLSSVDSEIVMNLLKEQTYRGRLVIVNIHQPGSDIYKMFDRIMIIDKGGYQVFYGNPTEAIVYFKTLSNHANPLEDQCVKCGNVNADQILQIVEAKIVDEHGRATSVRRVSPKEWARKFSQKSDMNSGISVVEKQPLPLNKYSIPGLLNQSRIFFIRDLLAKLSDKQYLLITLLGSPLLALLLAWFTKHVDAGVYKFSTNQNIPAYIFMCVITSMFFGLMVSSEEIVSDRKILKRESFLNLSWFSYLNSKIIMMFIISAFQTLSFILIGNLVLEIRDMTFSYWLVLFTTSCFANILGLNISSAFNSVITIYIIIPFIIIPQLLFSGVLVKFDQLHKGRNSTQEYVPFIGDLMTARWAFEAMAVRQFKDNEYSRHLFASNAYMSQNFSNVMLINVLENDVWMCRKFVANPGGIKSNQNSDSFSEKLGRINYHIKEFSELSGIVPGNWVDSMNVKDFSTETAKAVDAFLDSLKRYFNNEYDVGRLLKDSVEGSLVAKIGAEELNEMKDAYENNRLIELATDYDNKYKTVVTAEKIVQKLDPGYRKSTSGFGRSHFFAPTKMLGFWEIDTYSFNLFVIWLVTLLLYTALYFNLLRKFVGLSGYIRKMKPD
jgi:ABC transport system ATP-binding/permease protein